MTNLNLTSNFIFGATERELATLSFAEIISGLMNDYKSFSAGTQAGIRIPDSKQERRISHSCILFAEGLRMAQSNLDIAKKLILASLFDFNNYVNYWLAVKEKEEKKNPDFDILEAISADSHISTRAFAWLKANKEAELLEKVLKAVKDFEDYKAEERRKEEEEKRKLLG